MRKLLCINFELFNLGDNIEQKKNQNDIHSILWLYVNYFDSRVNNLGRVEKLGFIV